MLQCPKETCGFGANLAAPRDACYTVFQCRREEWDLGSTPYSIRLDDDLKKSLEREAAIEDRPPAQLAVRAIRLMLEAKAARRAAIDAALEDAEQARFISAEAMNAWIDSWDSDNELSVPKADTAPDRA
jgi:predicted transcriptional regulator